MSIVFAAATSHAPGITAWTEAASEEQRAHLFAAFDAVRDDLAAAEPEALIVLTSEHWANFFLDHIGAFCVGRADQYAGPVEPWLRVERTTIPGDAALAQAIIDRAYDSGFEPDFAHELEFDHGTMVPLSKLRPQMDLPIVPVMFNTLAAPQPSAARCYDFGRLIGEVARASDKRVALIATGGLSHDPGEKNHGLIDQDFDRTFMERMARGDGEALRTYSRAELAAAGAGTFELLAWIALRGAVAAGRGRVLAYEAVVPWATGTGVMEFEAA